MRTVSMMLLVLSVTVFAGCGGSDHAPLGQVAGTVTYQGKPIPSGTIIFEVPGARAATGKIIDGQITEVTTYDPGDGVPIGTAKIAVFATEGGGAVAPDTSAITPGDPSSAPAPGQNYMGAGAQSLIPPNYNDPAESGLTTEIQEGENTVTLDLKG